MTIQYVSDVEFGSELPATQPDTSLKASSAFAKAVGYAGSGRFEDHEKAREQGLPGALVPGIMGMGFFTSMIHKWAPSARIKHIDTVFRAPVLADHKHTVQAVVTDIVYAPLETPLLKAAKARGNPTVDGLGMLLHQARPGFRMWFGKGARDGDIDPQITPELRAYVGKGLDG